MKKITAIIACIVLALICIFGSCKEQPSPQIVYIPYGGSDSAKIAAEIVFLKEELRKAKDTINAYKNDTTISAELFVAKYKLERIRYYNNIAAKGNNIIFLRGWINRVLNE